MPKAVPSTENVSHMPVYEYTHNTVAEVPQGDAHVCALGRVFEVEQPIAEDALAVCPECGRAIHRLISRTFISAPTSDSDLKSMGFTKLVKRDTGVYENVTRTGHESRYMEAGKPETMPDIQRKISD